MIGVYLDIRVNLRVYIGWEGDTHPGSMAEINITKCSSGIGIRKVSGDSGPDVQS